MAALAGVKRSRPGTPEEVLSRSGSSSAPRSAARRRLDGSGALAAAAASLSSSKSSAAASAARFPPGFVPLVPHYVFLDLVIPFAWPDDSQRMYRVSDKESAELRASYSRDATMVAAASAVSNLHHNLTYGEVIPSSISKVVIPALRIGPRDVFVDLGSGTGKIPAQVALETRARKCLGVEFARERCELADQALARFQNATAADFRGSASVALLRPGEDAALAEVLRHAAARLELSRGDFIRSDLDEVTVVFVNNRVFEDDLRQAMVRKLAGLPQLRRVVSTNKLCFRCGKTCQRHQEPCTAFQLQRVLAARVTWAETCELYVYDRVAVPGWFRPTDVMTVSPSTTGVCSEDEGADCGQAAGGAAAAPAAGSAAEDAEERSSREQDTRPVQSSRSSRVSGSPARRAALFKAAERGQGAGRDGGRGRGAASGVGGVGGVGGAGAVDDDDAGDDEGTQDEELDGAWAARAARPAADQSPPSAKDTVASGGSARSATGSLEMIQDVWIGLRPGYLESPIPPAPTHLISTRQRRRGAHNFSIDDFALDPDDDSQLRIAAAAAAAGAGAGAGGPTSATTSTSSSSSSSSSPYRATPERDARAREAECMQALVMLPPVSRNPALAPLPRRTPTAPAPPPAAAAAAPAAAPSSPPRPARAPPRQSPVVVLDDADSDLVSADKPSSSLASASVEFVREDRRRRRPLRQSAFGASLAMRSQAHLSASEAERLHFETIVAAVIASTAPPVRKLADDDQDQDRDDEDGVGGGGGHRKSGGEDDDVEVHIQSVKRRGDKL